MNEGRANINAHGSMDSGVILKDVYHVPELKKNLVSVSQITDSEKYVLFGPKDVMVLDNVKSVEADILLIREKKESMFLMSAREGYVEKTSKKDSAVIWHARLGHVGYQMLRQISSKKLLDGVPALKDVHTSVVCQGCQYEKGEAMSKFTEFKTVVEKEFSMKVKCLRSDNGGEYMSNDFLKYCDDNNITRQMTCPDTPQQNGVAELKLGHLVAMSLSCLHDKNLPRQLWAEAVRSASRVPHTVSLCHQGPPCVRWYQSPVAQGTVASAKKILWDSLLSKTMANTKERIDALEAQIHDMFKSDQDAPGILKQFSLRLDALEVNLEATDNTRYAESMEWERKFQELQDRVEHRARHSEVVNTPAGGAEHSSRPRVPEPKSYGGARDAKELENFLFDIKQYFRAIRVDSEATKVSMAAMYLVGDAKLWWRKKYAEIEDGSCVINTWEILKRELKSQFFPENTAFNARKALLECKHTGSVREYCQAFSALMLDISDMSAVDRLFFFMEGLKPWARTELNRRRVNNLNEAIIAAESLSDYTSEPQRPPQRGNPSRGIGGKKPGGPVPNQSWGSKSSWASNSSTQQKSGVGFKAKPDASTSGEVKKPPFRGCFLCQGPHVIANCPQRQMMNAFFDNIGQVQRGEQSGSRPRHPPTDEQTDTQDYEEEDAVGAFPQWCNAVTTQVGNPKKSSTGEEPKDMPPKKKGDLPGKGLMYVDIKVNGKAIRAMVDT
ncbi:hypothetical protein RJ639_012869 [Escallonia herrerae]|uniref:Integrase catalytic domain-containing protein n=1 Tax=Escallonia herrerae TaxID=1293975 RepID=A0AA89ANR8_9ASTE|nr:hypothetical protein RJ639_012869 [Escallonia herrerae]